MMTTLRDKFMDQLAGDFESMSRTLLNQIALIRRQFDMLQHSETIDELDHNERLLDSLEVKMRDNVINAIVLYTPRASDLRKIFAYYDMTHNLERSGDQISNISGFLQRATGKHAILNFFRSKLLKMLDITETMTQNAIFAFTCEDIRPAKDTIELDDCVDGIYHEIRKELTNLSKIYPKNQEEQTYTTEDLSDILCINSISYNIERIGDNAVNIAEAAIYLIEGRDIRHSEKEN